LQAIASTTDERRIAVPIDSLLGSPSAPLSLSERRAKAQRCLDHVGLGSALERLARAVDRLELEADVGVALAI
jgi:hypothetical protein